MNKFRSAILSGKGLHGGNPLVDEKQGVGAEPDDLSSFEIPRHETRSANHREDDRHRLAAETATVRFNGADHVVDLINLSGGGAMIRADFAPRLWDRVDLLLGEGLPLECAVRWLRGDRVGLEFAHETCLGCDPAVRDAMLLDVIRRTFPDAGPAADAAPFDPQMLADAVAEAEDASGRVERRHPLIWSGDILFNHESTRVRLRNISATGALIETPRDLPEGSEVMLDLAEAGQIFATVSWLCGDQCGLAFRAPFDIAQLAAAAPEVAPQRWVRPTFLDLPAGQSSPWEEQWDRRSIDQLRGDLEGYLKR